MYNFEQEEAKVIAYRTIEQLFPDRALNQYNLSWIQQLIYRNIVACLVVVIKEGATEQHDTP